MFDRIKWFKRGISAVIIASMVLFGTASMVLAGGGSPVPPDLGAAGKFAVLGEIAAVTLGTSHIAGDVSYGTAFTNTSTITGTVYAGDGAANLAFDAAYAALAGMPIDLALGGSLAGEILTPGVYSYDISAKAGILTLDAAGDTNAVWIFKSAVPTGYLATGATFSVVMANGGIARNVYWWVDAYAALTGSNFQGNILAGSYITATSATINGNALAKTAVTTTGATIISPMYGTQLWRLDQTTVMEKAGGPNDNGQTGSISAGLESIWIADQAALTDVTFASGPWTVKLETTDWHLACSAEVGYYHGDDFHAFAAAAPGSYSNGIMSITINAGGMVSKDDYLALKIINTGGAQDIITEGSSYLAAPAIVPDYPLPELATGILLTLGLAGLVGFMVVRRRKALAVKIDRA